MIFDANNLFTIMNLLAMTGWVLLILLPSWNGTRVIVLNGSLSITMALVYVGLLVVFLPRVEGGFNSLDQVQTLFSHPYILLAGWVHYLAFDLFIGAWITRDAKARNIRHLFIVPVLFLTFMLGPAGLLLYYSLRAAVNRCEGIAT